MVLSSMRNQPVAVVIPTLNAAGSLSGCLAALDEIRPEEIVVVDGGSSDGTVEVARAGGARVLSAEAGRGNQMMTGATTTTAPWLLFLHADTRLAPGAGAAIARFLSEESGGRAGYFRFALDDDSADARRLERLVSWRCRFLALPYGDQGLLIHRRLYDGVGGMRRLPLMEDVDLVRRLGSRRLLAIPHPAVTSAERFRREGFACRSLRNLCCLALYFMGVPPARIVRLYR